MQCKISQVVARTLTFKSAAGPYACTCTLHKGTEKGCKPSVAFHLSYLYKWTSVHLYFFCALFYRSSSSDLENRDNGPGRRKFLTCLGGKIIYSRLSRELQRLRKSLIGIFIVLESGKLGALPLATWSASIDTGLTRSVRPFRLTSAPLNFCKRRLALDITTRDIAKYVRVPV